MAIFNSYVKLPEGKPSYVHWSHHFPTVQRFTAKNLSGVEGFQAADFAQPKPLQMEPSVVSFGSIFKDNMSKACLKKNHE